MLRNITYKKKGGPPNGPSHHFLADSRAAAEELRRSDRVARRMWKVVDFVGKGSHNQLPPCTNKHADQQACKYPPNGPAVERQTLPPQAPFMGKTKGNWAQRTNARTSIEAPSPNAATGLTTHTCLFVQGGIVQHRTYLVRTSMGHYSIGRFSIGRFSIGRFPSMILFWGHGMELVEIFQRGSEVKNV